MRIGIIGAATVGQVLAKHFANAGHDVLIANSRGPESLKDLATRLGPNVAAGHVTDAVGCAVVFLAVPWIRVYEVLTPDLDWGGRILVDATNIFKTYAPSFEVDQLRDDSGSEIVARRAPAARVVKAFNTLPMERMFSPAPANGLRRVLFVAGDDADAVSVVAQLIEAVYLRPVVIGSLATGGRLMQLGGPLSGLELLSTSDSEKRTKNE